MPALPASPTIHPGTLTDNRHSPHPSHLSHAFCRGSEMTRSVGVAGTAWFGDLTLGRG